MLSFTSWGILWVVSAIRYGVGTDFWEYYNAINNIDNIKDVKNFEYLYYFIIQISKNIVNNGQFFIALMAFLTLFFLFLAISNLSPYPEISIIIFFGLGHYFTSFNAVRQYLAISIILYALSLYYTGKKKRSIIFLISPIFIHFSSVIFVILFIFVELIKNKRNIRNFFLLIFTLIILLFYSYPDLFYQYVFIADYEGYLSSPFAYTGANPIFIVIQLIIFLFYVIFIRIYKIDIKSSDLLSLAIPFSIFSLAFTFLGVRGLIFTRLATYFNIFHLIFIPQILSRVKDKQTRYIFYFILVIMGFFGMLLFLSRNLAEPLPYNTFLEM